ncbi:MAG: type II toxin-antitoxin system RelE/ParE family toxin [Eubacterium sp.]|nr:type II toxin-antitoxin system RelE/ParE family toxin [Eubacterium sp.]
MKRGEYSLFVRKKLMILRNDLMARFGTEKAKEVISKITRAVKSLMLFEEKGISVSAVYGVECDYRYLYISHNYLFYRIEDDKIIIVEMFHEREDFMYELFGIKTTQQETYDYWKE